MRYRMLASIGTAAGTAMFLLASMVGQDRAADWTTPRMPWGDPDLEGIWTYENTGTPMERPARYGNRELLTDAEVAEVEKQALARYQQAKAKYNPNGPRVPDALERVKGTVEEGIYGQEYNVVWMEEPRKPGPLRWKRTSLVVDPPDGQIPPYTMQLIQRIEAREEARKHRGEADSWEDRNLNERCMTPQAATGLQDTIRIVQAPGWVTILPDGLQAARIVPLDGRPQPSPKIRGWFGRSRGRWNGDELIVETTNFIGKLDGGPIMPSRRPFEVGYIGSGETLRRVETYRRLSPDQIEYGVTTDDPNVYVKPFTILRPMILKNDFMMLQSGCHEGNYGMPNILAAGRADEEYAMRAAREAATQRKKQIAAMKREAEEWSKTGSVSADAGRSSIADAPNPDR